MNQPNLWAVVCAFLTFSLSGCAILGGGLASDLEGTWTFTSMSCGATPITLASGTAVSIKFEETAATITTSDADCASAEVDGITYDDDANTFTKTAGNSTCSPASCTLTDPFSGSSSTCSNATGTGSTETFTVTVDGDSATLTRSDDCDGNSGNGDETVTIVLTKQ